MKRALLVAVLGMVSGGCTASLARPTTLDVEQARVQWATASLESLSRGRELYVSRCGSCHTLYLPESRPAHEWPEVVREMQERAHLAPGDSDLVEQFLVTMSAREQVARR